MTGLHCRPVVVERQTEASKLLLRRAALRPRRGRRRVRTCVRKPSAVTVAYTHTRAWNGRLSGDAKTTRIGLKNVHKHELLIEPFGPATDFAVSLVEYPKNE